MKIKTQIFEKISLIPSINDKFFISDKNIHHLKNVLRLKHGDIIKIIFNEDYEALGEIINVKKEVICNIIQISKCTNNYNLNVTVCFAICKASQNELIAEKLTELGVKNIYFWNSEHTSYKFEGTNAKKERLEKIIEGASRQSKQTFIPKCEIFNSLNDVLKIISKDDSTILYCSLDNERKMIRDLKNIKNNIYIFIGPEGDFSGNEYNTLKSLENAIPVTLGNSVLKSETAAIVATSLVFGMM